MCACGCFLLAGLIAAMVYFILHALWLPAGGVVVVGIVIGWLLANAMKKNHDQSGK